MDIAGMDEENGEQWKKEGKREKSQREKEREREGKVGGIIKVKILCSCVCWFYAEVHYFFAPFDESNIWDHKSLL